MNETVTEILEAIGNEDPTRPEDLIPLVYDELRKLAAARMGRELAAPQTLQATALVHEAYLRLVGSGADSGAWKNRGHFFGAAAEAMRRILVERARKRRAARHGGALRRVSLDEVDVALKADDEQLLQIDEALQQLEAHDPQAANLIQLRFYAGMTQGEAAAALGLAERTAGRVWAYGRAWLYEALSKP